MRPAPSPSWLVTGAEGLLGRELVAALAGREVRACGRAELDITDADAVDAAVSQVAIVVNAAAYTAVDAAERDEATAFAVNGDGAGNLARAAARHGTRLIHLSTDYVFDGRAEAPYAEHTPLSPISAYGRSKAEGERQVLEAGDAEASIVRTAWLYGGPGDFVQGVLARARAGEPLRGADDQFGQPSWARDVARRIVELGESFGPGGIYHATNSGAASRLDFMRAILDLAGLGEVPIIAGRASDFDAAAMRPAWSVLGHARWATTIHPPLRPWREALEAAAHAAGWAA